MPSIGRNEPCPCGSGRKYKYCCLNFPKVPEEPEFDEYGDLGMSVEEFEDVLVPFFDHPDIIRVADRIQSTPTSALTIVLEAIHELEPVSVRNPVRLPKDIQDIVIERIMALPEFRHLFDGDLFSDDRGDDPGNVRRIHPDPAGERPPPGEPGRSMVTRAAEIALATLEEADIIVHRNGRLVTKATYREEVDARDYSRIYPLLFRALVEDVFWSVPADERIFEDLFGFTLLQLARAGTGPLPFGEFAADFFDAFPALYHIAGKDSTPEENMAAIRYVISVVYGFWIVLGLVDIQRADFFNHEVTVRPLLSELVQFPDDWDIDEPGPLLEPPDFDGLSPASMHALLYAPFDSPDVISFADAVDSHAAEGDVADGDAAPILVILKEIIRAIDEGGLKATKTGALPRAFVQSVGPRIRSAREVYWSQYQKSILKETDIYTLHTARIVLELAGVLRKYKGKFIIGRAFRPVIKKLGVGGVYPALFRTAVRKYNWAYGDRVPALTGIQTFVGFSLRLLLRYGHEPRPDTFYADAFMRAFPVMLDEIWDDEEYFWTSPEDILTSTYTHRTFAHFGHVMGLVHQTRQPGGDYRAPYIVRATPLLRAFVRVHV